MNKENDHGSVSQDNKTDHFADRLKLAIGDESTNSFAIKCGIKESSLRGYFSGSMPGLDKVVAIAEASGVSIAWLATGEGSMRPGEAPNAADDVYLDAMDDPGAIERNADRAAQMKAGIEAIKEKAPEVSAVFSNAGVQLDNHWCQMLASWLNSSKLDAQDIKDLAALVADSDPEKTINADYDYVTLYDAECSAGDGAWNDQCRPLTKISFTKYSLRKKGLDSSTLSAIRVSGDSMEGELSDGDAVLIDHSRKEVKGEGIYVIRLDDHLYAKRLQRTFDGMDIISTNRAYGKMHVPKNRLGELEIIGQVVWSGGWLI